MQVTWKGVSYDFSPWSRRLGRVIHKRYSFDCETTLIDEDHSWLAPAYVIGVAFDGEKGYYIRRDDTESFFKYHKNIEVVFHNAPFDLAVIYTLSPDFDIYQWVDQNQVWDTQILHRLYVLGRDGHTAGGKGESSLEHCVEVYLRAYLPKDVKDSKGNLVRLSYARWLNRPASEIEPVYLEYLARDVIATRAVFRTLKTRLKDLLDRSDKGWGFVSRAWLKEQVNRWGEQTHHIQLRASIVLKAITANGLRLDTERRDELAKSLKRKLRQNRKRLHKFGYLPGQEGSGKALQAILKRLAHDFPEMVFPLTETGQFATSRDALQDLADTVPFVKLLFEYREIEKLLGSFVSKMNKRSLHASFDVLARTGRTTSFGEINAQNLPANDRVRSCFVPSPGHVFIDADYTTVEMATLAQACIRQFGLDSKMADAINEGKDLHRVVAAHVTGKPEDEVTDGERKKAKPINFGKPGGMGDHTLQHYAKASYGVSLEEAEVVALTESWFELFPEMKVFLADNGDIPKELARFLDLTPASHYEHTGDIRFLDHPENAGRENEPHPILGAMCLKAMRTVTPTTNSGKPYSDADLDYFWTQLKAKKEAFDSKTQNEIGLRRPTVKLQRCAIGAVGAASVFTLTGRLRSKATYTARHNTVFQGLAADGAKLALWRLWRAGYRIVNFIHDQMLIEVPIGPNLARHAWWIRRLMIRGMKEVVPDVKLDVSCEKSDRWT